MVLTTERICCFNPFEMPAFFCPVCGGKEFVELVPNGGVWCAKCNAEFDVNATCDGLRKVAVRCNTRNVWSQHDFLAERYWTMIWQDDDEVTWMARVGPDEDSRLVNVALKEDTIVVTKH